VGLILTFVFMLALDQAAFRMIAYALQMKLRSSTWLMFPLFWPQLTIFIGFVLLTLLVGVDIVQTGAKLRSAGKVEA
jgi:hypothetical protein